MPTILPNRREIRKRGKMRRRAQVRIICTMTQRAATLTVPRYFRLEPTVLSHGWVYLPPFGWAGGELTFALRGPRRATWVRVREPRRGELQVSPASAGAIEAARWVLRLDEPLDALHALAAGDRPVRLALERGAGRLLRAPTVWEEAARVLCTTNIQWAGTRAMMAGLTALAGGVFPTPDEVLAFGEKRLQQEARMGYRAASLMALAEDVAGGFDIEAWRRRLPAADAAFEEILSWRGFGPYAAAHLLVQLGHYGRLPIDSEVRAFHAAGRKRAPSDAAIRRRYARYGDYAFLAYKLRRVAMRKNWIGD